MVLLRLPMHRFLDFLADSSQCYHFFCCCCFVFFRQAFSVALEPVLELDQAGLELTEILLPLPPKYWD